MNIKLLKKILSFCDIDALYYQLILVNKRCKTLCSLFVRPDLQDWILSNVKTPKTIHQCIPNAFFYKWYCDDYTKSLNFKYIKSYSFLKQFFDSEFSFEFLINLTDILEEEERKNKFDKLYSCWSYAYVDPYKGTVKIRNKKVSLYQPLFIPNEFWFDALLISIQYPYFPTIQMIQNTKYLFTFKKWNQFYRRCHRYGRLDLIQHIPSFDTPFVIDWQTTIINCNDDETAKKLLPFLPPFKKPPSLKTFQTALSLQLFSVMDTLLVKMDQKPLISLGCYRNLTEWAIRNSNLLNLDVNWSIWDIDRVIYESEIFFDYWINNYQSLTNKPKSKNWENLVFWNSHPKVIKYFVSLSLEPSRILIKGARSVDAFVTAHQLFQDRFCETHLVPLSKEMYQFLQNNKEIHWTTKIPKTIESIFNNDQLYSKLDTYSAKLVTTVIDFIANFLKSDYLNKSEKTIVYCKLLGEANKDDRQFIQEWAQKQKCNKILRAFESTEALEAVEAVNSTKV